MPRPTRQEIDDEIVEHASALFARHGFKDTSLQSIADAAGYSKTGLLHRFPSKEALWAAVVERSTGSCRQIQDDVAGLPIGPERDRAVLTALVDLTLGAPGVVALLLSVFSTIDRVAETPLLSGIAESVLGAFGDVAVGDRTDLPRRVRVLGALGALAVAGTALRDVSPGDLRDHLVAAAFGALGHPTHPQIPAARRAPARATAPD
jgi:AcrR family transcriptional regulator